MAFLGRAFSTDVGVLILLALARLALHLLTDGQYGFHLIELLDLVSGELEVAGDECSRSRRQQNCS